MNRSILEIGAIASGVVSIGRLMSRIIKPNYPLAREVLAGKSENGADRFNRL